MEEKRNSYRVSMGKPEGKRSLVALDIGGRRMLKLILKK
jgi:hypothetical protein